MEELYYFNYDKAKMYICRSTRLKEKLFRGKFFCYYSDKHGKFNDSEESYRDIREEDIPICVKYCEFIEQCLFDYKESDIIRDCYDSTGLGRFYFRLLDENKYEIIAPNSNSSSNNLTRVQFYFKEKFKYNYFNKMVIDWSNNTDDEKITIEGLYPEQRYWDPIQIQGKQYDGLTLHSLIYYEIGYRLSNEKNPFRPYSPYFHNISL